jgi:ABC-type phosphate transport system permease subunit
MRETKRTGQDGFGMALAGTIIGAIPIVLWLLYLSVFIGIYASGWQWAP